MTSIRGRTGWLKIIGFIVALMASRAATAQVTQTDASQTPLPQPVGSAEHNLIDSSWSWNANTMVNRDAMGNLLNPTLKYGDVYAPPAYPQFVTGDAITLSGLFKWRKEAIDPLMNAKTGPGYLSGKCGFSAEVVLIGGACQARFGWYNVDPASHTPPASSEIYPFIAAPYDALHCVEYDGKTPKTDGFCPLAWDNRDPHDLSIQRWIPTSFSSGDLSQDLRYKGGAVAFALIGDPQKCPQNKYSMYEHNQRNSSGTPWVTSLIYQSTVDPNGFYIAFEDLPMSADDWKKRDSTGTLGADGDFNDYVVYVSRPNCPGEVDVACVGKSCPEGQSCELGVCKDPCAGVVCSGNALCVKGACLASSSGAGGSAGSAGGTASTGTADAGTADAGEESVAPTASGGAAGDDDGATSEPGSGAQGGAIDGLATPAAPAQKSSSCGFAAFTSEQSPRAWQVLAVAFGLAFARRRRPTGHRRS